MFKVISFFRFQHFQEDELAALRDALRDAMSRCSLKGTILLATEGINASLCGTPADIDEFAAAAEKFLGFALTCKVSFASASPFRRAEVRIKPEIVTLKREVNIQKGEGTHVSPAEWNELIMDPDVYVLDARNDYEYRTGTFEGAVNPRTTRFSELPDFVSRNLDPRVHRRVAMFCTGGIRCEKFAPYMKERGFQEVYQLDGGILNYLAETPPEKSLWRGECFVFDSRVSVDEELREGASPDLSQDAE